MACIKLENNVEDLEDDETPCDVVEAPMFSKAGGNLQLHEENEI